MRREAFNFHLPSELIAEYPLAKRRDSRLLHYQREHQTIQHYRFEQLPDLLNAGDLLVMNDSKVIPARFFGRKATGGQVEFLLERIVGEGIFFAHIKASKALRPGMCVVVDQWTITILEKCDAIYRCRIDGDIEALMEAVGQIPLPHYLNRAEESLDRQRYQTVYAKHKGSVAAPTAGLHFDEPLLAQLTANQVELGYLTLHVGAGTFKPVRCDVLTEHVMHGEYYQISAGLCEQIAATQARGGRVIAVGTTAMRSLESAAKDGLLKPCQEETRLFIYPGYTFKVCQGLITNFHLPESTLLMLVAAFIGYDAMQAVYQEAIAQRYRFFSYGDASLLL